MSFLKQILKPFVEFDEDILKEKDSKNKTSPPASAAHTEIPLPYDEASHPLIDEPKNKPLQADPVQTYSPSGTMDKPLPEHVLYFEQLIEHANANNAAFSGADYKEFIDNKMDIDDIQDEALRYKTAFNILKGSGLTKAKLLETGQAYLEMIGRDLNNFQGAQSIKYRKETGPKEEEIQKKATELQDLQQKITKLKNEINLLSRDVNVEREKLNTIRSSFLLAGELKQNEIVAELKKIDHYFDR